MAEESTNYQKKIIKAAINLFRNQGYEKTSVSDICKEAKIARSTFYLNFHDKKEIILKIVSDARLDQDEFFGDFIAAANDFERMLILCNRYLSIVIDFGPEVTGALFRLELQGELDILGTTHTVDEWMVRLTENCQKSGIILSPEPAEEIAPLGVDIAYYSCYEWCMRKGNFDLRKIVRQRAETLYSVAPQYRIIHDGQ